ncbi:MAG: DUF1778 domain-containing protein [Crinalium sp.]
MKRHTNSQAMAVSEAASLTIQEHEMIFLNALLQKAFVEALLNSPVPTDKLRAAARRYKQFLGTSKVT